MKTILITTILVIYLINLLAILISGMFDRYGACYSEWIAQFILSPLMLYVVLHLIILPIFTGDWKEFNLMKKMGDRFQLYVWIHVMLFLLALLLFIMWLITANFLSL